MKQQTAMAGSLANHYDRQGVILDPNSFMPVEWELEMGPAFAEAQAEANANVEGADSSAPDVSLEVGASEAGPAQAGGSEVEAADIGSGDMGGADFGGPSGGDFGGEILAVSVEAGCETKLPQDSVRGHPDARGTAGP